MSTRGRQSPVADFVDVKGVKDALGITAYDAVDDGWLETVVRAVNETISQLRPDLDSSNDRVKLGAVMLATRWYGRRNAQDIAAFAEFGGPPPALDRDVEMLLEVGRAFRPVVA